MMSDELYVGRKNGVVMDYLQKRRSCKVMAMGEPGPPADEIGSILQTGARVPDHGKLAPWRFIVFTGDARKEFGGRVLREAYLLEDKDAAPAKLDLEAEKFLRAPCVIAVISSPKDSPNVPEWEQRLSAGAVAYNICLAANAHGYGTNWLSEWPCFNARVERALGVSSGEKIAGFIYIGTATGGAEERPRPEMGEIVTYWG